MEISRVAGGMIIILSVLGTATREHHGTNQNQVMGIPVENARIARKSNVLMEAPSRYAVSRSNTVANSSASMNAMMHAVDSTSSVGCSLPTTRAGIHVLIVVMPSIAQSTGLP